MTLRRQVIAGILTFAGIVPAEGQRWTDSAFVRGRVRTPAGGAVGRVVVRSRGGQEARTSEDGSFVLGRVRRGALSIELSREFYRRLDTSLVVDADTVDLSLVLTPLRAIELPPVTVDAERSSGIPGFDARRAEGFGRFITRAQIDSSAGSSLAELLRRAATRLRLIRHCHGGMALASATPGGVSLSQRPHRDPLGTCQMPQECYAQIFVDGVRLYSMNLPGVPPRLDAFALNGLEAVEYYAGGSQVPSQFGGTGASCGTLVLWTRRR